MTRAPLWSRAVRSRPLAFVLLLLLGTSAVATAALGPLLVRAAGQAALADAVTDAGPTVTTVQVAVRLEQGKPYFVPREDLRTRFAGIDQGPDGDLWTPLSFVVSSTANLDWRSARGGPETSARVNAAEDGCAGYVLTAGRCPAADGEVLLSARDADRRRVAVGDDLRFALQGVRATRLTVVGSYDADRSLPGRLVRPGTDEGSIAAVTGDPVVTTADQLLGLKLPASVTASLDLADGLRLAEEPAARATLDQVQTLVAQGITGQVFFFDSPLGALLDRVDRQSAEASVLIGVAVVQALGVAFFALFIVLQRVGRARGAEWGTGRLRGIPTLRWWRAMVTEPLVALVVGLPLGLAAATLVARVTVTAQLGAGVPVEPGQGPVLIAAGAALAGAAVALLAVVLGAYRRPTVELIQQAAERRRLGPLAAVGQTVVVLLAAASVYQLLAQDQLTAGGSQLGLLAPALLALAVAVVTVRIVVLLVRRVTRRPPRGRLGLVVARQLGRTPSALNPAVVIAAALALAVFAGQVLALSERNQDLRAQAIVGAPTVLSVSVPNGRNVADLVAAADPSGRYAMAVQERAASADGGISRIVAVDAARYHRVGYWATGWADLSEGGGDIGRTLHPDPLPAVELRGTELTLTLSDVRLTTRAGIDPYTQRRRVGIYGIGPPSLQLALEAPFFFPESPPQTFVGELRAGAVTYRAKIPCRDGCRLAGLTLSSAERQAWQTTFTISALATDRQPASTFDARLRTPGWTGRLDNPSLLPQFRQEIAATPTAGGLRVQAVDDEGMKTLTLEPGDAQDPAPALLGPTVVVAPAPGQDGVVIATGLDGQPQLLRQVARAAVLPRSLDDGVLVDLTNLQGLSNPRFASVVDEVWLAADAPPSVEQALSRAGVQVQSRQTFGDTRDALRRQPTTRGASVAVTVGYAALALALLTLLTSRLADGAARRRGWRALRDAGLRTATLRWLAAVEIGLPAVLGVLVGTAAGVLATVLAAPRLPLTDTRAPGPPPDLALAWAPVVALGLVAIAVVLLVAAGFAVAETRGPRGRADR